MRGDHLGYGSGRRKATVSLGVDIGIVGQQQFLNVNVPFAKIGYKVQWRPAVPVHGIHVSFVSQQQLRHVLVAANRKMQRVSPSLRLAFT